jgi:DNA-directed RNA polymerase-5 subunit 1
MSVLVIDDSLTQMPTNGKLHITPRVQFSFSDANTILSESIEGTVKVIADSVGSGFLLNVT